MEKYFNQISIWCGVVGGFIASLCGGGDVLLVALAYAALFDYITGWIKSAYQWKLSSKVGFKGILKKILMFVIVAATYKIEQAIGLPIRDITVTFYLANEALSICENAAEILPIPTQIKNFFLQIRENADKGE